MLSFSESCRKLGLGKLLGNCSTRSRRGQEGPFGVIGFVLMPLPLPGLGLADDCQLFLQFHGPSTILLQSQASRLADILSSDEVNEIANTPPGAVQAAMKELSAKDKPRDSAVQEPKLTESISAPRMNIASIGPDRKVTFEATKEENK